MNDKIANQLIKQEQQLLDKTDSLDVLADLIDDEFIEIGSSSTIYNKTEVMRWLASDDPSERLGTSFKIHKFSEDVILLTYISSIKDMPGSEAKKAMRSSIWRLSNNRWQIVFHQGTPLK
jgi:glyoxylase I family protein